MYINQEKGLLIFKSKARIIRICKGEWEMENTSMSEGSIAKKIIYFAIPLFLGNLFQQLYNTADSLIVGNFLGSSALAAVASSGNLIFLLVGFFNGIFVGAGVVIARYFGAKDELRVHRSIHTLSLIHI